MLIRKMVKADAAAYRDLRLRGLKMNPEAFGSSYEESSEQDIEVFRQRIPEPDSENVMFVAEEDGQFLGTVSLVRETFLKMKHKAYIYGVYVDAHARGRGIGRLLMQRTIDHARQLQGLRQLVLSVMTTNMAALNLYQSLGFTIYGTEPAALFANGIFYDEHNMILYLNEVDR
jgi:ribosomal protein S18 acetylase RimI-like enzyme